jgi:hypothetical protein
MTRYSCRGSYVGVARPLPSYPGADGNRGRQRGPASGYPLASDVSGPVWRFRTE